MAVMMTAPKAKISVRRRYRHLSNENSIESALRPLARPRISAGNAHMYKGATTIAKSKPETTHVARQPKCSMMIATTGQTRVVANPEINVMPVIAPPARSP
ncbi:hypothetical protein D3C84_826690 [compost metagenome]